MNWTYENKSFTEVPENFIGFVYRITNLDTGMMYLGKKLFKFTRTKRVKGKKQKRILDSGWEKYYGSNKELNEHVETLGPDKFKREILHLCRTKGECSYLEAKEILVNDAIISPKYYNSWLSLKVSRSHLPKG